MLPLWLAVILVGACAGAVGDWAAARLVGGMPAKWSLVFAAVAGAVLGAIVLTRPLHGWHERLLPVWLWGWLVAADADLRAQELYDVHTAGLLVLALAAGVADHEALFAAAGAAATGGLWLVVRGGLRWWTWWTSVVLAVVGVVVLWIALLHIAQTHQAVGAATKSLRGLATGANTDPKRAAGALAQALAIDRRAAASLESALKIAFIGGFGILISPILAWIGAISRRAAGGETVVGGADVLLWAAMGAWFGLRWVWPVFGTAVVLLAVAALAQAVAVRTAAWKAPWGTTGLPVVPIVFLVLLAAS